MKKNQPYGFGRRGASGLRVSEKRLTDRGQMTRQKDRGKGFGWCRSAKAGLERAKKKDHLFGEFRKSRARKRGKTETGLGRRKEWRACCAVNLCGDARDTNVGADTAKQEREITRKVKLRSRDRN